MNTGNNPTNWPVGVHSRNKPQSNGKQLDRNKPQSNGKQLDLDGTYRQCNATSGHRDTSSKGKR